MFSQKKLKISADIEIQTLTLVRIQETHLWVRWTILRYIYHQIKNQKQVWGLNRIDLQLPMSLEFLLDSTTKTKSLLHHNKERLLLMIIKISQMRKCIREIQDRDKILTTTSKIMNLLEALVHPLWCLVSMTATLANNSKKVRLINQKEPPKLKEKLKEWSRSNNFSKCISNRCNGRKNKWEDNKNMRDIRENNNNSSESNSSFVNNNNLCNNSCSSNNKFRDKILRKTSSLHILSIIHLLVDSKVIESILLLNLYQYLDM